MYEALKDLKCSHDHEHQPIEGSTHVHGKAVPRSKFSEVYPRKFARLVAQVILKKSVFKDPPVGSLVDPILLALSMMSSSEDALVSNDRLAKRPRLQTSRRAKSSAADRSLDSSNPSKRPRFKPPDIAIQFPTDTQKQQQLEEIIQKIESHLPRVGKQNIHDGEVLQLVQRMFPDKIVKRIVACKGTERTIGPPSDLSPKEAPFRRAIMRSRVSGRVSCQDAWEQYDLLAKRQVIRKLQPCRVNITVFADNPSVPEESPTNLPAQTQLPNSVAASRIDATGSSPGTASNDQGNTQPEIPVEPTQPEIPADGPVMPDVPTKNSVSISDHSTPSVIPSSDAGTELLREPIHAQKPGNRFLALPREEQAMLRRAHQNLCHPSPSQLSAVLKAQGARSDLTQAVFDMPCDVCANQQQPKIARPSTLKDELDFNDKVFIDGVTWTNQKGKTFHFYHMIDQATNYHTAIPAPNRAAENAAQSVLEAWFQWAGPPNLLVTDSATEFTSEYFANFLQRFDVKTITIAPHAHWQNGRCERHGHVLQQMLSKVDLEYPVDTYMDLQQSLVQCTQAKNALSIRRGFTPEILVFGKSSRLPGSLTSSENDTSLASADRDDAHGISFRKSLALREKARTAFHQADNDMSLRRAYLRRTRPDRMAYKPGEWIMMWQPDKTSGYWFGPLKVVNQESNFSIWATQSGKLYRRAPEHARPVCSSEARMIPIDDVDNTPTTIPDSPINNPSDDNENGPIVSPDNSNSTQQHMSNEIDNNSQSIEQPDDEPEAPTPPESIAAPADPNIAVEIPVPESVNDDELTMTHLLCCEDEVLTVDPLDTPCAWRCELDLPGHLDLSEIQDWSPDDILLATSEKKQRTEVKLTMLNSEERKAFEGAKEAEIQNWLKTGTVSRILRSKLAPEQILRCRWVLVWKPLDDVKEEKSTKSSKLSTHKPKARLVVLGYLDPKITEVPRDSPTLGRQSKMLILQLIASMGWCLGSFDIRAAFLQGRPQNDRVIGIEPVTELIRAMQLKPGEVCKLEKSAYGLIDAPYLWFQTLYNELISLGFTSCPFDPCVFTLKHPKTNELCGILGVHVDDGIHGGNAYFQEQRAKLEKKYPFGSKKSQKFTFTGIDLQQNPDNSIELSQTSYVKSIIPISINHDRRAQEDEKVTEEERHLLRGLIGSLQYAAVSMTTLADATCLESLEELLEDAKVLMMGWGNPDLLGYVFKVFASRFTAKIIKRVREGSLIFLGLGAGAMLAGQSFALTAAPKPQLAELLLRDMHGLQLAGRCAVRPHWNNTDRLWDLTSSLYGNAVDADIVGLQDGDVLTCLHGRCAVRGRTKKRGATTLDCDSASVHRGRLDNVMAASFSLGQNL
eukprot:s1568_g22.t1